MTGNAVRLAFEHLRVRAGMSDFHFHDLRHEAISRLFEKGLNIAEVSAISGHKSMQMLKRILQSAYKHHTTQWESCTVHAYSAPMCHCNVV